MTKRILKYLGIFFISLTLSTPLFSAKMVQTSTTNFEQGGRIYVHVYECNKHYIYVYESDGTTLVTIIEEEW